MSSAAGTAVDTGNCNQAHRTLQFFFAAVVDLCKLCLIRVRDFQRKILKNRLIGQIFDFLNLLGRKRAVKIQGHLFFVDVEANIVTAIQFMRDPGNHVFSAVLLHQFKSPRKIDLSVHLLSGLQGRLRKMHNLITLIAGIQNLDTAQ